MNAIGLRHSNVDVLLVGIVVILGMCVKRCVKRKNESDAGREGCRGF